MSASDYKKDQKNTVDKWDTPPDQRTVEGAGTYPNQHVFKSRAGSGWSVDDSEGAESMTLFHRSGTRLQFGTDGHFSITAHNGQYTVVFGENRMLVTGAQDVTVQGGGSLRVEGDYNMTVMGNHNTTVNGDMNITAKNMNTTVRGNMDTAAKNMSTKIEGSTSIETEGVTTISSDGGLSIASTGGPTSVLSKGDLGIGTTGKITFDADGEMHLAAGGPMLLGAKGKMSLQSGDIVAADANEIWIQSGKSDAAQEMSIIIPRPNNPNAGGPR
jgi:hypothetical protein